MVCDQKGSDNQGYTVVSKKNYLWKCEKITISRLNIKSVSEMIFKNQLY